MHSLGGVGGGAWIYTSSKRKRELSSLRQLFSSSSHAKEHPAAMNFRQQQSIRQMHKETHSLLKTRRVKKRQALSMNLFFTNTILESYKFGDEKNCWWQEARYDQNTYFPSMNVTEIISRVIQVGDCLQSVLSEMPVRNLLFRQSYWNSTNTQFLFHILVQRQEIF